MGDNECQECSHINFRIQLYYLIKKGYYNLDASRKIDEKTQLIALDLAEKGNNISILFLKISRMLISNSFNYRVLRVIKNSDLKNYLCTYDNKKDIEFYSKHTYKYKAILQFIYGLINKNKSNISHINENSLYDKNVIRLISRLSGFRKT